MTLEKRIAAAIHGGTTAEIDALRGQVETAAKDAHALAEAAQARSLDPILDPAEAEGARREASDSAWRRDRLGAALTSLDAARVRRVEADKNAARRAAYEAAKARRDASAKSLRGYTEAGVPA